ncbi:SDR family oxidoreductase [Streptomyces longwoodensis]|uniref:SDR family oxidoreductase n=1 Tax=Streptomyces longwoodensis TaxID=68231 RepID=UPI0033E2777A
MTPPDDTDSLVAVVGTGIAVPGASSPAEFWRLLNGHHDAFSEPGDRFRLDHFWSADAQEEDKTYARRAGYLHDFHPHPHLRGEECPGNDRDQAPQWLRHALLQAREHVRTGPDRRCAAYVGAWPGGSQSLVESALVDVVFRAAADDREAEQVRTALFDHYRHALSASEAATPDAVVREIFSRLPESMVESCVVDTACASSLYAVDLGVKALLAGECDIAYCGGVTVVDPTMAVMFAKLNGLSRHGRVRAFTQAADGTLFSDGAAVVVLKTLRQARNDGDTVHGVLLGFGGAADGRGKSISAPNPAGQRRAIERARSVNGLTPEEVDWVVAHGTGTAAGDSVESQVLSALGPSSKQQLCSSNKPVLGHTGWTAGVVSLIHALLGLRHGWVPAQLGAIEHGDDAVGDLAVPAGPVRLSLRPDGRRTVGVSAFGFGGTNAHLLVADRCERPGLRSARPWSADEDMVLVAWSAHLPGSPSRTAVRDWLRGSAAGPDASFPVPYPAPQPAEVRLSAKTLPVVDPGQLMGLQAAARFVDEHGEIWADLRDTTGVIAAHTGMPRGLVGTAVRCYAQDTSAALRAHASKPGFTTALTRLEAARQALPACTEDSQAGVLPNVIASRLAARYDLHGPTLAVDSGKDGALTALRLAQKYLRTGELDLALVLAVNGNSTATNAALTQTPAGHLAEGAFLLAVTTSRQAEQHGWQALAKLSYSHQETRTPAATGPGVPGRSYLAADPAVALLRAVEEDGAPVVLRARHSEAALNVEPLRAGHPAPAVPPPPTNRATERYVREFIREPLPAPRGRPPGPRLPLRGVVLAASTDAAEQVRADAEASESTVLVLPADAGPQVPAGDRQTLLTAVDRKEPHLTVVGDLSGLTPDRALALHEMTFLAVQRLWAIPQPGSSLTVLLTGATNSGAGEGVAALFEGLVKSLRWERPDAVALTVASDEKTVGILLAHAALERTARPCPPPVVRYLSGERHVEKLLPAPLPAAAAAFELLPEDCVGVITGGTSGIAQALLTTLPQRLRPRLWLMGRTPEADAQQAGGTGDTSARTALVRQVRQQHPDLPMRSVVTRVDSILRQRQVHEALRALRARFGDDHVHYVTCDVTVEESVREVIDDVLRADGRVDFVLHAAGQVASTVLQNKTLEAFRSVRDTKVLGHRHLTSALAARPPRWWCNIGSYSGSAGAPGDTDYASANAYLAAVAETATAGAQTTIGFTMWRQTGMGADELFQEHVARQGQFTPISTEEGTEQFTRETEWAALTAGSSVYLGSAERDRLRRRLPGYVLEERPRALTARRRPSWWVPHPGSDSAEWAHQVSPQVEHHLYDHLVSGKPTVPATFMLDLAAQAAEALVPDAVTTGFRAARFDTFLRPLTRKVPSPLRIRAQTVPLQPAGNGTPQFAVQVSVHSDALDPHGAIRPGALQHFQVVVLLDRHPRTPAPQRSARSLRAPQPARDAYRSLHTPVSLRGPFRNLSDCLVEGAEAHGTWTPSLTGHPWLRTMTTPALYLCAALRTLALRPDSAAHQPLFVPRSIGRIDLYTDGANDHDLLLCYGHSLTVSVDATGTCVGATPDGRLLAQLSEVELVDLADPPPTAHAEIHPTAHRPSGSPRRASGHTTRPPQSKGTVS